MDDASGSVGRAELLRALQRLDSTGEGSARIEDLLEVLGELDPSLCQHLRTCLQQGLFANLVHASRYPLIEDHEVTAGSDTDSHINLGKLVELLFADDDLARAHACADEPTTRDDPGYAPMNDPAYCRILHSIFSSLCTIDKIEERGVSLAGVSRTFEHALSESHTWFDLSSRAACTEDTLNHYNLFEWLVKPATHERDCALAELLCEDACLPNWFLAYWWGESVKGQLECIRKHAALRGLTTREASYWHTGFAIRQHSSEENISEASFFNALQLCGRMLLTLDEDARAFSRMWVGFELYAAIVGVDDVQLDMATYYQDTPYLLTDGVVASDQNFNGEPVPDVMRTKLKADRESTFPISVLRCGISYRVQDAFASLLLDRNTILNNMVGASSMDEEPPLEHSAYDQLNLQLRSRFALAAWRQALEQGQVAEWGLPSALRSDIWRTCLSLDLSSCLSMCDGGLASLASGLPRELSQFHLAVSGTKVSDAGVVDFAARLQDNCFTKLSLDFMRTCIASQAIEAIRSLLSASLTSLSLNLACCHNLCDGDLQILGQGLPGGLQGVTLNLRGCTQISDSGVASLAASIHKGVQSLNLSFSRIEGLTDTALKALAEHLPEVDKLALCFSACREITDTGLSVLASKLHPGLKCLHLQFDLCSKVTETSLAAIANRIVDAESDLDLKLEFRGTSANVVFTGMSELRDWQASRAWAQEVRTWEALGPISVVAVEGVNLMRPTVSHGGNRSVFPEHWGMTLRQFNAFIQECKLSVSWQQCSTMNGYDMCRLFVRPYTRGTGSSVALTVNPAKPLQPTTMLSHAWGEDIEQVLTALNVGSGARLAGAGSPPLPAEAVVWFCIFANYQCGDEEGDMGPTVEQQLDQEPFRRVICLPSIHLVVIHTTAAEVYSRLWCVYEIDEAITAGVPVSAAFSDEAFVKMIQYGACDVDTEAAKCNRSDDEWMLREYVLEKPGGFSRLSTVISNFRFSIFW
eukprot:TRINITY_DN105861_c0_g1_i1.p1 TRINITY_DN105861_c0_g1~~TRINITY_DN105861_c0_g1_i1.p1  ORF type:complete len:982 (+),score=156.01 TRINITY_DN105861_c0_g1_i1:41-2986(+)